MCFGSLRIAVDRSLRGRSSRPVLVLAVDTVNARRVASKRFQRSVRVVNATLENPESDRQDELGMYTLSLAYALLDDAKRVILSSKCLYPNLVQKLCCRHYCSSGA